MNITTAGVPKRGLPDGFVYIDEVIEDAIIDPKYWGTDNFVGRPINGYDSPLVVTTVQMARACAEAAEILRGQGYVLKIFDSVRPQRAVDDFVRFSLDDTARRKPIHYPSIDKAALFRDGYVAERSRHSRGAAIDLTIADAETGIELDMGTPYDYMDPRSHVATDLITAQQEANRRVLRQAMLACGLQTYEYEWWHFDLVEEPHPDTYFDFPIA